VPPRLSLYWIARLTASLYQAGEGSVREEAVAETLEQTVGQSLDLLERAKEAGYVEGGVGAWQLSEHGVGVGQRAAAAYEQAAQRDRVLHYRPYTEFLPTGSERLD
jgi:hypothetical protein